MSTRILSAVNLLPGIRRILRKWALLYVFLLASSASLRAADVMYFSVAKGLLYLQTNSSLPSLKPGSAGMFQALTTPTNGFAVFNATIGVPPIGSRSLFPTDNSGVLSFRQRFNTQSQLDGSFNNGTYTFSFFTAHDGSKSVPMSLTGDAYPNLPHLSNFDATQSIEATASFQITWDAFAGGTSGDFIAFWLEDTSGLKFGTATSPGGTNTLDGTATGFTIPAGKLSASRTYLGHLQFQKITAKSLAYAGATGTAGYFRQTDFFLTTKGPGDSTPPVVVSTVPGNGATGVPVNTPFSITFSKPMGTGYAISVGGTTNFTTRTWSADQRTCTFSSTNFWPLNTTLTWTLNYSGAVPGFGDVSKNPLMSDTIVSFTTGVQIQNNTPASPTLLPPSQPVNGLFHLAQTGEAYRTYVCQSSTDLVTWTSFATNRSGSTHLDFFDAFSDQPGQRFYRVIAQPGQ